MLKKRLGNDVVISWTINKADGTPEDFTNVLELKAFVRHRQLNIYYEQQYTIEGNVVTIHFTGLEQKHTGVYDLYLNYTKNSDEIEGGVASVALDYEKAFDLVPRTSELIDEEDLEFVSLIDYTKGHSAYQIALMNGFVGTETEWLLSLKGVDGTLTFEELTEEQKLSLKGDKGDTGAKGDKGDPFIYSDFTQEQLALLKGEKGDKGDIGLTGEQGIQGIQGVKGDKGDAFTYEMFTPEQLATLKGEKGDKGDKGDDGDDAYQIWLDLGNEGAYEDFIAYLRQPAVDAAESISELEGTISDNESNRILAENERKLAEIARENAEGDATKGRVKAENDRVAAEILRNQVFGQKMNDADDKIEEMDTTLSTYDGRVMQVEDDIDQLAGDVALKVDKSVIKQTTGVSTTDVMSQKAVTDELGTKASHGYSSNPKTLKQVDDSVSQLAGDVEQNSFDVEQNSFIKITNLLQKSSFENGDIAPVTKEDGFGGASTFYITMDPDTGALYVGLKMITSNPTPDRPILYLNGTQNRWIPSHVFYFGMSVRVNSGTPIISGAHNGAGVSPLNLTLKDGFNSWTVVCVGFDNFAAINFDGTTLWNFNFDSLIAYDLTVIFGEGNEPTKEEMDLLISILDINYFEGEITIPAQNVMQWQLALIRQNTAAILAIGGSII